LAGGLSAGKKGELQMRVSRSRLTAVALVVAAACGAAFAAGSFASGNRPAAAGKAAALAQRTFVSAETGNDANPCSRTAPCRNFAAAIAQTTAGGEVVVLDSGGYGTVTIMQAISLVVPPGVYAGISVFAGAGITVNAGASDVVTIRGLTLNGLGGSDGIDFNSGAALHVQDSVFKNFSSNGVTADLGSDGKVVVDDSLFTGNLVGLLLRTTAGTVSGTVEHSRFEDGGNGVEGGLNSNVVIRDSVAVHNVNVGFDSVFTNAQVDVENSLTAHNGSGLRATSTGKMRVSETTIEENALGLNTTGGTIVSFGNNRLAGNTTNGAFTSTIPLQ